MSTRSRIVTVAMIAGVMIGTGTFAYANGIGSPWSMTSGHRNGPAAIDTPPTPPARSPGRTPAVSTPKPTPTAKVAPTPTNRPTPTARPTNRPTPTARPTNRPTPTSRPPALIRAGTTSDQVRDLEARLVQLDWLPNSLVDGYYGTSTTTAVQGYQAKRGLPGLGYVDAATWTSLLEHSTTPTHDQLYPPKPTPTPTKTTAPDPSPGQTLPGLDPRCATGHVICINKSTSMLAWMVDGKQVTSMSVRFGCSVSPTREGTFSVFRKIRDGVSDLYGSRMPFAMYFSGGEAVHYSSDFAARGYNGCSHGCVNVRDWNAIALMYDQVHLGDKVVVYWS